MYCAKCGHFMDDDMMFCPECGEKVLLPDEDTSNGDMSEENVNELMEREPETKKFRLTPLVLARFLNQKADQGLRTKNGRIVWGIVIGATTIVVGATIFRGAIFYKNYNWLYQYELSEETVSTLEKEIKEIQAQTDETEKQYQELQERYEVLASHDMDKDWETSLKQKILELSVENQMAIEKIKANVMNELGYQYTPEYDQREAYDLGLDLRDGLIDEIGGIADGGSIVSSTVKEALNAAAGGASMDHILDGAKRGLTDGIVSYVRDSVIGDFGGTVLTVINTKNKVKDEIESMGTVPPESLNELSDDIEKYVNCMKSFVEKERITQEDIHEVYQAVCGYRYLNATLEAMMTEGSQLLDANDIFFAQDIQEYDKGVERLKKYIEIAGEMDK